MATTNKKLNIGILGFGNMGRAIFESLKSNKNYQFYIYSLGVSKVSNATCLGSVEELINKSDIVFLSIKPQDFYNFNSFKFPNERLIIVSIMAGVKIANIRKVFKTNRIVRTMPNLALQVNESTTGWYAENKYFSEKELETVKNLLNTFGKSFLVKKESMLDTITAISGSGPAYVFLFMEALVRAGQNLGFPKNQAQEIVTQTLKGSLKYFEQENEKNLKTLISRVKSKKGTTEAALKKINIPNFYFSWQKAVIAAEKRARELSSYEPKRTRK